MTPYERAHRNAIDVQDACNSIAVINQFQRDMKAVSDHLYGTPGHNTDAIRVHPVAILYVDKLLDLQHRPDCLALSAAWDACQAVVEAAIGEAEADLSIPVEAS